MQEVRQGPAHPEAMWQVLNTVWGQAFQWQMREKMAPRRAPWRRWHGVGFRRLVPLGSIEVST